MSDRNYQLCPTCHAQWVGDGLYHAVNWEAVHRMEFESARLQTLLHDLAHAADVFTADQSYAAHPSCGAVPPVTVVECEALNAALRAAAEVLKEVSDGN